MKFVFLWLALDHAENSENPWYARMRLFVWVPSRELMAGVLMVIVIVLVTIVAVIITGARPRR